MAFVCQELPLAGAFQQALTKSSILFLFACVIPASFCFCLSGTAKWEGYLLVWSAPSLLHSLLKAPCSSSMVILLLYLSSASCLPSNKHHPRLAIPLVIWKRTGDQWQSCCHGTVYSCRVEFCCKARESQSLLASSHCRCNLRCLVVSTAERDLVEACQ